MHILNTLTSLFYDIFSKLKSQKKKNWVAIETHYKQEKSGSNHFFALNFYEYVITTASQLWIKSVKFK